MTSHRRRWPTSLVSTLSPSESEEDSTALRRVLLAVATASQTGVWGAAPVWRSHRRKGERRRAARRRSKGETRLCERARAKAEVRHADRALEQPGAAAHTERRGAGV